jgi:hypothetical protein
MGHPIRVQTQLKSRYPVFDAFGKLPFDLVFGLRRKRDSDPRDVSFQVTRSFLDAPYGLAKGFLQTARAATLIRRETPRWAC